MDPNESLSICLARPRIGLFLFTVFDSRPRLAATMDSYYRAVLLTKLV